VNIDRLEFELRHHPDRDFVNHLVSGLRHGFDIFMGDDISLDSSYECRNLQSARENPEIVDELLMTEVQKGFVRGPFEKLEFPCYRVSPLGIATGKYSGKKRLILDLSSPHDHEEIDSVNNLIDKEKCSLKYVRIDDAIAKIKELGPKSILCKTDISDAFKLIPVDPKFWPLLCVKWRNLFFYFVRLPFGSRSSPKIFDQLSQAICWIAKNNYGIKNIFHLLDDFLTIDPPNSIGERTMALLCTIFKRLNIPISVKKTVGPTFSLEYLGIILDSEKMEARLPTEKRERICNFITEFLKRSTVTKRELLQLLGHFNFAARVVLPGRAFTSYLINLSTTVKKLHYFVKFTEASKEDLSMWLHFLEHWNGVSVFYEAKLISNADMELYTDASSTIGFGGYYRGRWFAEKWPKELTDPKRHPSMAFLELYPIVMAAVLWGTEWKGKKILFHCDNAAVVDILRKRRSSDLQISSLIRTLCFCAANFNFDFYSEHLAGTKNNIADALSRLQMDRFRRAAPQAEKIPTSCPSVSEVIWNSDKWLKN
jgi:hypothetical protein